jgi:hypothetical protein
MGRAGRDGRAGERAKREPRVEHVDPREQLADWLNCRSSRRLYVTLNEAGADTGQLVLVVGLFLLIVEPRAEALAVVKRQTPDYESMLHLASGLGEELTCALIRRLYPSPPGTIRGTVAVKPGSQVERSQRVTSRAKVWIDHQHTVE